MANADFGVRIISPRLDELSKLRQPLTPGERAVLDLFLRKLHPDWEIYVQPHLNGLRPDFVLLNPKVGIGVFEVKDWDLSAMSYRNEYIPRGNNQSDKVILRANHDGRTFDVWPNPILQLRRYKEEIHQLYCPRIDERNGFAVITAGLIFPFATRERVKELMAPHQSEDESKKSSILTDQRSGSDLGWLA
jgi:hypothetical protein